MQVDQGRASVSPIYEAGKATQLHGRGTGAIVLAISVIALLFCVAVAANFRGFAGRMPWRGRSSDPERQAFVVTWNRVGCGVFAVVALVTLIDGVRLIATGSM
ncbi:hypothetical protein ABH920_008958 [Catenulispora sp. EB89]|uniref:hypothetical protein n=1 Tax=Catenulispora sp. EB89 TaxID=3156257 RepID=UPI0035126F31